MSLSVEDNAQLVQAKQLLENPGLAAKITDFIGSPIEQGFALLPKSVSNGIGKVTEMALMKASDAALFTMKNIPHEQSSDRWHKLGVAVSGGVGGFFGLSALALELPISTTIMLRSIADIARSEGEQLDEVATKMACIEVFALGGESNDDDQAEKGYFAVRTVLANSIAEAAEYVATKGFSKEAAPMMVKLVTVVAERFGVQVTQKVAAQAVPAIGAAGGAIINTLFIDHFQDMARGHFIVRKLERKYGEELVKLTYQTL
ncbi:MULTISPECIES: EcsC family protein [unclassified Shewanella]|uniref:EcsC family protein n=1 Tax=unclassified Shewanella TaxID=196818 RepID=UPI000C844251|nr:MULTISPECIES: EcsC family protein [unclassified Shewanella]MDO6641478.1 EcsC family protein [Shewanella sp. 5_MG-2023]MDO6679613.1 EcsC family protein [Shewanella sp. 4_MG-2023]MDO6776574.1 EcsC family protein [Shewanella sp. 3_MG-2023]PMG52004.1 peptidase [Shewanella sp. 10N.286.52.B9]PMH87460.1 peptidase [Shewanella sp. 10N.286.48.B5]